ncbi:PTS sugar transporter subunit IIA [Candidatus Sumerlaeota bacterium]|nr:PTS sugar transporter subunit IIA [Candidatus Sumerlaeota bacterium]
MKTKLSQLIVPERIVDLECESKEEVLTKLVELLAKSKNVSDKNAVLEAVFAREKVISTGIGIGIAVPHVKIPQIKDFVIAIARLKNGIDFQALDDEPVHLVIMIGANDKQSGDYLKLLAEVIKRCKDPEKRRIIMEAKSAQEIADHFSR